MYKKDPFDGMEGGDGFRIKQVEYPTTNPISISLHICAYFGGKLQNIRPDVGPEDATVEIKEWLQPTPSDMGACDRLKVALEGIARYLNTGGEWEELAVAVEKMQQLAPTGLRFPGYHLLESVKNYEGDYEHLFVQDGTENCVLWVENNFIDYKTLEQVKREREEASESEPRTIDIPKEGQQRESDPSRLLTVNDFDDETENFGEPDH